jgi:hypothetical protein
MNLHDWPAIALCTCINVYDSVTNAIDKWTLVCLPILAWMADRVE